MAIKATDKITIGNKTFSLNVLIANPAGYLHLMQTLLTEEQFAKKQNEAEEKYLSRIFTLVYNKINNISNVTTAQRRVSSSTFLDKKCEDILSDLGIEIVKKCPVRSKIMFKNNGNEYRINNKDIISLTNEVNDSSNITNKNALNDSQIKIGVELEFIGKLNKRSQFIEGMNNLVGKDRLKVLSGYNKNEGTTWVLGKDSSVKANKLQREEGMSGFELTSPILSLGSEKDLIELYEVCELIKSIFGGEVNKSCGTHIHMSFPVVSTSEELKSYFAYSYYLNETSLFDKLVPLNRRENNAKYASSMKVDEFDDYHIGLIKKFDRYHKLNLTNVKINSKEMHLEFRQLDGTLEYDKIVTWTKLQKKFVDHVLLSWSNKEKMAPIYLGSVIMNHEVGMNYTEPLMKMSGII